jgi:hypothetical protein
MQSIDLRVLHSLFHLSRANRPTDASALAEAAGVSATRAGAALCTLERLGLVDATRARLTMLGLARATATGANASGGGGPRVGIVSVRPIIQQAPPLAARSEYPPAHVAL